MARHLRLGVVIRLRELAEDAARGRLAVALECHHVAGLTVLAANDRRAAEIRTLASAMRPGATASNLAETAGQLATAETTMVRRAAELERAAEVLFDARRQLAEATRQRETVVRLRDRIVAEEHRAEDRKDAERLGDVVSARHVRELQAQADQ